MSTVLHFNPYSQPSKAVALFISANALEIELKECNLAGRENKTEEYLALNPAGKVPTLVDGDFVVSESAAIMQYLAAKYKVDDHWFPSDLKKQTKVVEYLHWHHSNTRVASAAFRDQYFNPEDVDIDASLQILEQSIKTVETYFLRDGPFIGGGDEPSIADLQLASELFQHQYGHLLLDLFDYPKVAALLASVKKLPGFNQVFAALIEFEKALPVREKKQQQFTIRGDREVLRNLRKARPTRRNSRSRNKK